MYDFALNFFTRQAGRQVALAKNYFDQMDSLDCDEMKALNDKRQLKNSY